MRRLVVYGAAVLILFMKAFQSAAAGVGRILAIFEILYSSKLFNDPRKNLCAESEMQVLCQQDCSSRGACACEQSGAAESVISKLRIQCFTLDLRHDTLLHSIPTSSPTAWSLHTSTYG